MCLVVSQSPVHFAFERPFFLRARSGAQVKLRTLKIGRLERNLSIPEDGGSYPHQGESKDLNQPVSLRAVRLEHYASLFLL